MILLILFTNHMTIINKYHLPIILGCGLFLTACSYDEYYGDTSVGDGSNTIRLAGEINQHNSTRANDEGFCNGDVMGVYIVDYKETIQAHCSLPEIMAITCATRLTKPTINGILPTTYIGKTSTPELMYMDIILSGRRRMWTRILSLF